MNELDQCEQTHVELSAQLALRLRSALLNHPHLLLTLLTGPHHALRRRRRRWESTHSSHLRRDSVLREAKTSQHDLHAVRQAKGRTCSSADSDSGSLPANPTALIAVWNAEAPVCIPGRPFACAGKRRGEP